MTSEEMDLFDELVRAAGERSDGHLTIMKFTTCWRVMFGTPNEREDIEEAPIGQSFSAAGARALRRLCAEGSS